MCLRHKVCISVSRPDGGKQNILKVGVIILTPGETVENVEIKEIGGEA